jgi:uncharacterized protein (DUF2147 family)
MQLRAVALAAILSAMASAAFAAPPPLTGARYSLDDVDGAVFAFEPCGAAMCGRVVALGEGDGPDLDRLNPDPSLRSRRLCNAVLIEGLTPSRDRWVGGRIYDPESGRTYPVEITARRARLALRVHGILPFAISLPLRPPIAAPSRPCPTT